MLGLGAGVVVSWLAVAWAAVPVPKCCPSGEVIEDRVCKHVGRTIAPLVYDFDLSPSDEEYRLVVRPLPCSQRMLHLDDYWILKDGSLHRGPAYQLTKDYCLEEVTSLNETYPLLCPASQASYYLNTIGYALSLPFALATLLVYVMLKDLNTLHGKIVIANMAAFIVGSLLLVLTGTRFIDPIDTYCAFAGNLSFVHFLADPQTHDIVMETHNIRCKMNACHWVFSLEELLWIHYTFARGFINHWIIFQGNQVRRRCVDVIKHIHSYHHIYIFNINSDIIELY